MGFTGGMWHWAADRRAASERQLSRWNFSIQISDRSPSTRVDIHVPDFSGAAQSPGKSPEVCLVTGFFYSIPRLLFRWPESWVSPLRKKNKRLSFYFVRICDNLPSADRYWSGFSSGLTQLEAAGAIFQTEWMINESNTRLFFSSTPTIGCVRRMESISADLHRFSPKKKAQSNDGTCPLERFQTLKDGDERPLGCLPRKSAPECDSSFRDASSGRENTRGVEYSDTISWRSFGFDRQKTALAVSTWTTYGAFVYVCLIVV